MNFEGTQVNIPIKGIMRQGTDNLAADGAMNEVVGMEYKDGSWLPYKEAIGYVAVEYFDGQAGEYKPLKNIAKVYIHNTSDGSNHHLFVTTDGNVYFESSKDGNTIKTIELTSGVIDMSFVGNVVSVATANGLEHYLWKENSYTRRVDSYPDVALRAGLGFITNSDGDKAVGIYCHQTEDNVYQNQRIMHNYVLATMGAMSEKGGLYGYCLAQVAFRLRNGEIVCKTPMQLICCPYKDTFQDSSQHDTYRGVYSSGFYETMPPYNSGADVEGGVEYPPNPTEVANRIYHPQNANGAEPDRYIVVPGIKDNNSGINNKIHLDTPRGFMPIFRNVSGTRADSGCILGSNNVDSDSRITLHEITNSPYPYDEVLNAYTLIRKGYAEVPALSAFEYFYRTDLDATQENNAKGYYVLMAGNGLQLKVNNIPSETDIESVCVFISPEVSPFVEMDRGDDVESMYYHGALARYLEQYGANLSYSGKAWSTNLKAKRRSESAIIADLKKTKNLYLVYEERLENIQTTNQWLDIDLRGKLGATLTTLEQLPLSAINSMSRSFAANGIDAYNYRLHAYDYLQALSNGFEYDKYAPKGGLYQDKNEKRQQTTVGDYFTYEISVKIKGEDGEERVVVLKDETHRDEIDSYFPPFISFPNPDAISMTVRIFHKHSDGSSYLMYEYTRPLTSLPGLGISAYFSQLLQRESTFDHSTGNNIPDYTEPVNTVVHYHNGLRVSDVAYPMYFPVEYTYRIGNGSIIGLARLTMPVSGDKTGPSPLIVFCTDGVYAMSTDTSGNGVYTTTDYISPEVCLNKNSICEINGAVLFSSDKGLMIIVGSSNGISSVEEFVPSLNGMPRFLPAVAESKEAHGIYRKMIDNQHILSKSGDQFGDSISTSDFVDFIKNADTHLVYISIKNKLLAYNDSKDYSYFIDIPTRNATKLALSSFSDDGQLIDKTLWKCDSEEYGTYKLRTFGYLSHAGEMDIPCLIQSRPIKVQQDYKNSYRVVLTGYFEGLEGNWADLVVMGSLDADNWRVIGVKEKKLVGGFHNIGCLTERGSWKYLMFIFGGKLSNASHIDSVDITVTGRYNNKKR